MTTQKEQNNEVIDYLSKQIDIMTERANDVRDAYLKKWTPERRLKLNRKKASQSYEEAETGRLIPRVRLNTGKVYIEWTDQQSPKVKRIDPRFTKVVTPHKTRGYTKEIIVKHSHSWERDLALEFESKFKPIRKSLDALHSARTKLSAVNRLYYSE